MWFLPVWTRQGHKKEKPQCENGTTKAMSGGIADTTSSSYRNIGKKQSLVRSARTLARSCGNSAIKWVSNWSRGMPCLTMCICVSTVGFDEAVIRQYIRNQE